MIMQMNHHVVDCPTCARPVEIPRESPNLERTCGHCHSPFAVFGSPGHATKVATRQEHALFERAEERLQVPARSVDQFQTIILVEHRDEVFARLATDIERFGLEVIRAESVDSAMTIVRRCDSVLVIANRDLPDQNGWVLADKLNLTAPHIEVWLYMPTVSMYAEILARFLKVTELVTYRGNLFTLSDRIVDRLAAQRTPNAIPEMREFVAA